MAQPVKPLKEHRVCISSNYVKKLGREALGEGQRLEDSWGLQDS